VATFDALADSYDSTRGDDEVVQAITDLLAPVLSTGGRMLDLAAGTGLFTSAAEAEGNAVVSLDLSLPMLRRAVARGARRPLQGDGAALPLRARSFESVLAVRLFQLVDDPRPILAELARVLRPGGVLAVTPVWPSRPRDAIGRAYWDAGQRVRAWTRRLAAAASDAGFRDHRTARGPRQSTRRSPNEEIARLASLWGRPPSARHPLRSIPEPNAPIAIDTTHHLLLLLR